jgi:hypothetical protein
MEQIRIKPDSRGHKVLKAISAHTFVSADYYSQQDLKTFMAAGLVTADAKKLTAEGEQALSQLRHDRIYRKP